MERVWGETQEGGDMGIYVYVWLIHFVVRQKLAQHCRAIILQDVKKKKRRRRKVLWLPYAKCFERPKPAPKRDCKEPLDGRIHHHTHPPTTTKWRIPRLDYTESFRPYEKPAGWSWEKLRGEEGDQGLSSQMGFDWTERKAHGYHPLESECVYDGILFRNVISLKIITRCYIKQNVPSVVRVTKWHGGRGRFHIDVIKEVPSMISNPSNISQNLKFYHWSLTHLS